MGIRFPYARQNITAEDLKAAERALTSDLITQGEALSAFEQELARYVGSAHAVACANGTAALHLAYLAAGLGPGRALVTSPVTFLATANAAVMTGAEVLFCDVDAATGNMDPESLARTLERSPVPVAVVAPVHLAGRPCDLPRIWEIAATHGAKVVEDACHALGANYTSNGREFRVGGCAHSDMAVFSFHAVKHVAMGEGGAICVTDPELAGKMRLLRSHGMERDPGSWSSPPEEGAPWYYEMAEIGYNYRLTEMQCALGLSQLGQLEASLDRRAQIATLYGRLLEGTRHLRLPPWLPNQKHAWHLFPLALDFAAIGKSRGTFMRELVDRGIGTQVHYIPLYRQPFYRRRGYAPLPGCEAYYAGALSIPMYPQLSDDDIVEIAGVLSDAIGRSSRAH